MASKDLYFFPPASSPKLAEWPGTPLGVSNTITRTKSRTAQNNKTVDATPGLLEKLLKSAHDQLARTGTAAVFIHDVVIHGIRVRATTNSAHLAEFWKDNWYSVDEWRSLTGQAPDEPRIQVYALLGVENEAEAAYYSRKANTILFFNTSYYGQLKSWVLGAVGRILAGEFGIHSIHGACVEREGKGVLYIAPTGTGKSTSSYGLMTYPSTRFHSDDWVYVRYAYATRDGRRVHVIQAQGSDGSKAQGYRVYRWIEAHTADRGARLTALTLQNQQLNLTLGELDLSKPLQAYAYTSEKVFYLRTNLAENFPISTCELLASKQENVPDVTEDFINQRAETLDDMLKALSEASGDAECKILNGKSSTEMRQICARMIAFDNARAMLNMSNVLPAARVYTNPLEPVRLAAVMLLKRDREDNSVLNHALKERFMERLLIGETPEKKRETAYNAYRAVDDKAERTFIDELEKRATPAKPLYELFLDSPDAPESLREEFELFRVMYDAARTFDLNTTLEKDPRVHDKREAVRRTIALIARTLHEEPVGIHLTIDNYSSYIQ